jgi:hypothetical protein
LFAFASSRMIFSHAIFGRTAVRPLGALAPIPTDLPPQLVLQKSSARVQ